MGDAIRVSDGKRHPRDDGDLVTSVIPAKAGISWENAFSEISACAGMTEDVVRFRFVGLPLAQE